MLTNLSRARGGYYNLSRFTSGSRMGEFKNVTSAKLPTRAAGSIFRIDMLS
jgi:hypothetical protein